MRFGLALLGLVIGGPIGAIIGYFLGVFIEKSQIDIRRQAEQSTQDAFFLALSGLAAEVIKADGVVSKAEVLFAKEFFIREFGPATADRMMKRLKIFVSERVPVEQICRQISEIFDPSARLLIIHFLHGLAAADGEETLEEENLIKRIAVLLGVSAAENRSAGGMYRSDLKACYDILEVSESASDEEVKRAYKKAAVKYHPDRVASLGPDVQKEANERFAKINAAYDQIKAARGMK